MRRIVVILVVATLGVLSLWVSLKPPKPPLSETDAPPIPIIGEPVTEDEVRHFARALEKAFNDGDDEEVDRLLHYQAFLDRVVSDLDIPRSKIPFSERAHFATALIDESGDGGSYKLLRIQEQDGRFRALFRLITNSAAFEYHEFRLARLADGKIGMEDVYAFSRGELLSRSKRRLWVPVSRYFKDPKNASKADADYWKTPATFQEIKQATSIGDYDKAALIYSRLPRHIQDDKSVMLAYFQNLKSDGCESEYISKFEQFKSLFPHDEALHIAGYHYYVLKKQYELALNEIDVIGKKIGEDPYLHVLRAENLAELGRLDDSRQQLEMAMRAEPTLENIYWMGMTLSLKKRKFDETVEWLKKVVQISHAKVGDLNTYSDCADFVKSPQHAQWLEWYRENKKK